MPPIIITGMHRSGTSMVARLLNLCGLYLGEPSEMVGPAADNPAGFWENRDVILFNENLLAHNGGGWDCPPISVYASDGLMAIGKTLLAHFNKSEWWGFKDPRAALSLSFWLSLAPDAKIVHCVRNPSEVADSLWKRNGMSQAAALKLWTQYNQAVLDNALTGQVIFTHYSRYFKDPIGELKRVLEFLGMPIVDRDVRRAVWSISSKLRRSRSDAVPESRTWLYQKLCNLAQWDGNEAERLGLVSLVVLTYNSLPLTKACLASIERHTPKPHELIIIDNASTDGTAQWLREYSETSQNDIRVIANRANVGCAGGYNLGLAMARGEVVVVMNNDLEVTVGWLPEILSPFSRYPNCGLVGPVSNYVSGPQLVPDVPYRSPGEMDEFAATWRAAHSGQSSKSNRLVGFCLAIHRDVIDRIGGFDERFQPGNFEDDDYCVRAAQVGFTGYIARAAFVHHAGHAAFADLDKALDENFGRFKAKWNIPAEAKYGEVIEFAVPPFDPKLHYQPLPDARRLREGGELLFDASDAPTSWPDITLTMIVRNEVANLRDCLESVKDLCSHVVVVDTGSDDGTVALAKELGCEVRFFTWRDDFAAARNEGLHDLPGKWIFWMDADDRLEEAEVEKLKAAVISDEADAYMCQVHSEIAGPDGNSTIFANHTRLFRNVPEVRFERPIHEDVTPALARAGLRVRKTNIVIEHTGYDATEETQRVKALRNRGILLKQVAEHPDQSEWRFHLGVNHYILCDYAGAIEQLRQVVENPPARLDLETELQQAWTLLVTGCASLPDHQEEGETYLARMLAQFDTRHAWETAAVIWYHGRQYDKVEMALDRAEALSPGKLRWPSETVSRYRELLREVNGKSANDAVQS